MLLPLGFLSVERSAEVISSRTQLNRREQKLTGIKEI